MAKIEFDGIDDLMDDLNIIEIECPNCGQEFEVSLDDLDNVMVCPHCRAKFEKTSTPLPEFGAFMLKASNSFFASLAPLIAAAIRSHPAT